MPYSAHSQLCEKRTVTPDYHATISAIIPVYNGEMYIHECLESLLQQKQVTEILVVNDHSTDGTERLVHDFMNHDPRIRLLTPPQDNKRGTASARNYGMAVATGEWLWFVDHDDIIPTHAVSNFFSAPDVTDADLIIGNYSSIHAKGVLSFQDFNFRSGSEDGNPPDLRTKLGRRIVGLEMPRYPGVIWCCLFRRSFIEQHSIEAPVGVQQGEDGLFLARVMIARPEVRWTRGCVYHYRTAAAMRGRRSTSQRYNPRMLEDTEIILHTRRRLADTLMLVQPEETYAPLVPVHTLNNLYMSDFPYSASVRAQMLQDISRKYHSAYRELSRRYPKREFDRAARITGIARFFPRAVDLAIRLRSYAGALKRRMHL